MKKTALILLLIACSSFLFAQTTDNNSIFVHFDKSFYVTGELLAFKAFLPEGFKGKAITLRTIMFSTPGRPIHDTYHKTEGENSFSGYIKIPYDITSDTYYFIITATEKSNKAEVLLFETQIPLFNDLEPKTVQQVEAPIQIEPTYPRLIIKISIKPEKVGERNLVNAEVEVQDLYGNPMEADLSIAVKDKQLCGAWHLIKGSPIPEELPDQLENAIYLRGQVTDTVAAPLQTVLLGIASPEANQIEYAKSDGSGTFYKALEQFTGKKNIQFLDYQYPVIQVSLQSLYNLSEKKPLQYTPEVLEYLTWSKFRKKVYQLSARLEYNTLELPYQNERKILEPDAVYRPDNYFQFKDLPEFYREIVTPLKFRLQKGEVYTAKVFNSDPVVRRFYSKDPVFYLDGRLTRDANLIAHLDLKDIKVMEIYSDANKLKNYFGALGYGGVIKIETNSGSSVIPEYESRNIFNISGYQPPIPYPAFQPAEMDDKMNQPYFRPQIYWHPAIKTDKNGKASFSYFHTDDHGDFVIEIVARTPYQRISAESLTYQVTFGH